jgi:hypothetical protein
MRLLAAVPVVSDRVVTWLLIGLILLGVVVFLGSYVRVRSRIRRQQRGAASANAVVRIRAVDLRPFYVPAGPRLLDRRAVGEPPRTGQESPPSRSPGVR